MLEGSPVRKALRIMRNEGILKVLNRARLVYRRRVINYLQRTRLTKKYYYKLFDSADYWERRYSQGHSSGPGSEGEHAEFKASFVNSFIQEHDVESVVEFGCGDGDQVSLGEYPSYIGLDVSESVIKRCSERFADDPTLRFRVYNPFEFNKHDEIQAELVLSMEVLFHLVEDKVFEKTMYDMFRTAKQHVIIFSSNYEDTAPEIHVRHRRFTDYVRENFPEFRLVKHVENPFEERVSDFYVYERTDS